MSMDLGHPKTWEVDPMDLEPVETDLHSDAVKLAQVVMDLDRDVDWYCEDEDLSDTLDADLIAWDQLEEANRQLAEVRGRLGARLGRAFPDKRCTVMGSGTYERHAKREGSTKCTDPEGLWRMVLDTRIVDEPTGEVLPTHEVIRRVYGAQSKETGLVRLTGASPSKVEALGLNPDDFFEKAPFEFERDKDGELTRKIVYTIQKVG